MLYVGYVLEKRLDVNAIIDNVVTPDLTRMCVFGSALYHCHNWRKRFVLLCRMHRPCRVIRRDYVCVILIYGHYYSLSKTNPCLYAIKVGFINFRHLRSGVTDVHPSRPYVLTAWLHNYFGRRQIDLRRSGYYGTQPRRVIS